MGLGVVVVVALEADIIKNYIIHVKIKLTS
jgi:hypothetical protein